MRNIAIAIIRSAIIIFVVSLVPAVWFFWVVSFFSDLFSVAASFSPWILLFVVLFFFFGGILLFFCIFFSPVFFCLNVILLCICIFLCSNLPAFFRILL